MEQNYAFILALLITLLIASNVYIFSTINEDGRRIILVSRVIDGDTLVSNDGEKFRLANINTPEKNEKGFEQALQFLSSLENTTAEIEEIGIEKYGRTLVRVYSPQYINLELVKKGLAKKFLVDKNELKEFSGAEKFAVDNSLGIWRKSKYFNCVESEINPEEEIILLKSICGNMNIYNWIVMDESRKRYKFPIVTIGKINLHSFNGENNETDVFWNNKQDIWNNDRDTLYIFDSEEKLVHYKSYGY